MASQMALLAAMLPLVLSLEAQDPKRTVTPPYNVNISSLNLFVTLHWKHEEEERVNFSTQFRGAFNGSTWDNCSSCTSITGTQCDVSMCVSYGFYIFRVRAERRVSTLNSILMTSDWVLSPTFNQDRDGRLGKPSLRVWSKANKVLARAEIQLNRQVDPDGHVTYNFATCKDKRCWEKQGDSDVEISDVPGRYCVTAVALYYTMSSQRSSSKCITVKSGVTWMQVMAFVFGVCTLPLCVAFCLRYCHMNCEVPQLPKVLQDLLSMNSESSKALPQEPCWPRETHYDLVEEVERLEKQTQDIPAEAVMPQENQNQKQPMVIYRGYS
uniref:Fibronectin type-III domain-containing protein n=1 Tax=Eptatretus burgeri TaxID=7764 RepID=A0A8C4NDC2_EPTBU